MLGEAFPFPFRLTLFTSAYLCTEYFVTQLYPCDSLRELSGE
jgi:hypothetical protein